MSSTKVRLTRLNAQQHDASAPPSARRDRPGPPGAPATSTRRGAAPSAPRGPAPATSRRSAAGAAPPSAPRARAGHRAQALEFDTFERSLRSVCRQTSVICRTRPPEDAREPGKAPAPPPRFTPQNPSRKCDSRPAGRSGPYIHLRDGLTAPDAAIGPFRPHRFSSFVLERGSARCRIEVSGDPARELRCRAIHWHNSSVDTRAACATCG